MRVTSWQRPEVAREFVDKRRAGIPFAQEQLSIMALAAKHYVPDARRIADLGCGDGLLARVLLGQYAEATAVLVDHSPPMLALAEESMTEYAGRHVILEHDLSEPLQSAIGVDPFDVIVSCYAIHHLPDGLKRTLYGGIFEALRPGGIFINVEHVASPDARQEALFDDVLIDNLVNLTGRDRESVAAGYHSRPDKPDNILTSVDLQLAWLRDLGYEHVDCYFKFLELAVFGGVKPNH
jgi:SAM-dependent methyltransferase